jgi:predicted secreted hydrolase
VANKMPWRVVTGPASLARRALLIAAAASPVARAAVEFAPVVARPLVFPRDHGAHPEHRIEWWYVTGWLDDESAAAALGFQVTFFRVRTPVDPANPSRFAAHQLLFAHAALAAPARASLLTDERTARTGFGFAQFSVADTDVLLERWRLVRLPDGVYRCDLPARGFQLHFTATPTQPVLAQGQAGFFPKSRANGFASHYYSQPQLAVHAQVQRDGRQRELRGTAWLDHEWSSTLLEPAAAGWDWAGMNLADGSALTALIVREERTARPLLEYASLRAAGDAVAQTFGPGAVSLLALERWTSPRTRAAYPIAQRITVGARQFETRPMFADQELDTRVAGSTIYWEGASTLLEAGRPVGRGYLELTGYASPLRL